MSKKKLKKFKKAHKTGPVLSTSGNIVSGNAGEVSASGVIKEILESEHETISEKQDPYKTDKYDHVKKDIHKILIIMFVIIAVLFATYYLSLKTTYLSQIGNWFYKIANIQTQ